MKTESFDQSFGRYGLPLSSDQLVFTDRDLTEESNCILPSGQVFKPATSSKPSNCLTSDKKIPLEKIFRSPVLGKGAFKITLPGHGSVKDHNCGEFKLALQCPSECDSPQVITHNCGRITCPVCYEKAISQMASRAENKALSVISSYRLNGINIGDLKHGAYSPAPGSYSESDFNSVDGLNKLRLEAVEAYKFLVNGDHFGIIPIVHLWRECHLDGSLCGDHNCQRDHGWYFSPHVHCFYTGYLKESTQLYHSKKFKGSIWKRIPDNGSRDIFKTLQYQLSHASIPFSAPVFDSSSLFGGSPAPDWFSVKKYQELGLSTKVEGHLIRYFGAFSNCKSGKTVIARQDRLVICPKCGSEIQKYSQIGDDHQVIKASCHEKPFFLKVNVYQWHIYLNGQKLPGIRSAEIDDSPYGYSLSHDQLRIMESSVDLNPSPSLQVEVIHFASDPATDSNWSQFNYYEY
ncbi:hypothetical protein DSECCO2_517960 [anaerobic digester metagenome]